MIQVNDACLLNDGNYAVKLCANEAAIVDDEGNIINTVRSAEMFDTLNVLADQSAVITRGNMMFHVTASQISCREIRYGQIPICANGQHLILFDGTTLSLFYELEYICNIECHNPAAVQQADGGFIITYVNSNAATFVAFDGRAECIDKEYTCPILSDELQLYIKKQSLCTSAPSKYVYA
jgi:hypothetical protein